MADHAVERRRAAVGNGVAEPDLGLRRLSGGGQRRGRGERGRGAEPGHLANFIGVCLLWSNSAVMRERPLGLARRRPAWPLERCNAARVEPGDGQRAES